MVNIFFKINYIEKVCYVSFFFFFLAKKDIIKYLKKYMASFKFLKDLSSKIVIWFCACVCVALKNLPILIIYKFLAYIAKNKFHKLQKMYVFRLQYKCKILPINYQS